MDIEEKKLELEKIKQEFIKIKEALKVEKTQKEIKALEEEVAKDGFWNDTEKSTSVMQKIKNLKRSLKDYEALKDIVEETEVAVELYDEMPEDDMIQTNIKKINNTIEHLNIVTLLNEEYDTSNAIITIHPGAGGTESQDWAEMLYRMYTKWAAKNEFEIEILDYLAGDEAGIKSITLLIKGMYAYGYMKCEKGVHRLVRISPFDSNSRRHTSFASVEVMPELDESIKIEIRSEDLEVDTYRASGAGGQHVNKTESAIRIKHVPTGVVVTCQTERSQIQNRENAMKMLRAKVYQIELQKQKEKAEGIKGNTPENGFGSQIRSYVFCPYTLVKDHRTNFEIGNVQAVMDGKIDDFMFEYLKMIKK